MNTIIFMVGCAGSGKSTVVDKYFSGFPVISRDLIREELGFVKPGEKALCSAEEEDVVTRLSDLRIAEFCRDGKTFVFDNTNTNPFFRMKDLATMHDLGATIIGVRVNSDFNTVSSRRTGIPESVLKNMLKSASEVQPSEFDQFYEVNNGELEGEPQF